MPYHHCDTTDGFVAEATARRLRMVVLAWREEYGPVASAGPDAPADYRLVREVTLLGYDGGTIVRCELPDADRRAVEAAVRAAGITVELRCRNLAAPAPR